MMLHSTWLQNHLQDPCISEGRAANGTFASKELCLLAQIHAHLKKAGTPGMQQSGSSLAPAEVLP